MTPEQLLAFRHRAGLTQASLATLLDVCKRNVEYYESGKKPIPRIFALACATIESKTRATQAGTPSLGPNDSPPAVRSRP